MSMPEPNSGCWLWLGSTQKGYGRMSWNGRLTMATHLALLTQGITVPEGLYACHHCDNRYCINPAHLFVGTPSDNTQDAIRKGRAYLTPPPMEARGKATGDRHNSKTKPWTVRRGENHGKARLSVSAVRLIRDDKRSAREIADQYGVTPQAITLIQKRINWRHVD